MDNSGNIFSHRIPWLWIFILAGALFYIPFIGGVHLFDWDEINFAEISREMIATGDYLRAQVDYKPFFEKPPFFFWIQSMSFHTFGVNEFAARLPNALCGIFVLALLYTLGSRWMDRRFGILWALCYLGSLLPALYHKSGIIDPWFNLFIFTSLAAYVEGWRMNKTYWFYISGILAGLAVLTKGPVAPLLIGLTVLMMFLLRTSSKFITLKSLALFFPGCIGVAGMWFGIEWLVHGPDFIIAFIDYQFELLSESVAGHKGFPGYHFVIALLGIFPSSCFAVLAFRKKQTSEEIRKWNIRLLMIILAGVVLVLFTVVKSKIVHYSSLTYYPVSFLSAWAISYLLDKKIKWPLWNKLLLSVVAIVIVFVLAVLPLAGLNIGYVRENIPFDAFTKASLSADVIWGTKELIPAIFFLAIVLISILLLRSGKKELSAVVFFPGTALLLNLFLIFFIGKIEHYSQRAAIEFYKSKEKQPVEIETLGFHSYAPFFYAKKPVTGNEEFTRKYYVVRADRVQILAEHPELKKLYEKNGFIFFEK